MNPFNILWIGLTWILATATVFGFLAGVTMLPVLVVVAMALMITGQTIGTDRAERDYHVQLLTCAMALETAQKHDPTQNWQGLIDALREEAQ